METNEKENKGGKFKPGHNNKDNEQASVEAKRAKPSIKDAEVKLSTNGRTSADIQAEDAQAKASSDVSFADEIRQGIRQGVQHLQHLRVKHLIRGESGVQTEQELAKAHNTEAEVIKASAALKEASAKFTSDGRTATDVQLEDVRVKKYAVDVSAKTADIAAKNLDMQHLDLNEIKAFSIITKYNLVDADKLAEFADKAKSGDAEVIKDVKTLQTSLKKDGKYKAAIDGVVGDGVITGVGAFISENADAIKKLAEAKQIISGGLTPSSGGAKAQNSELHPN